MVLDTYELVALACCFIASGFFSGSEAALMSIGVDRARQLIEKGGSKGEALKFMVERPNELLTTILVGNNVVNILAASLTTTIAANYFKDDALGISVGITTIIILIFGEILPKTFARTNAEKIAVPVIRILQGFYYLMFPIIKLMVLMIEKVLGEKAGLSARLVIKSDIEYMVNKAEKEKTIDSKQIDMLNSILEFPKIKAKDIMVPRTEIKYLKVGSTLEEILKFIREDVHSRYPVCEGELENMIGFLHAKDLVFLKSDKNFDLKSILKEPFFVYEHMRIQAVFDHMNRKKVHLALVKDETGLVVGIVTLEDIVEEIVGEIQDEHDLEEESGDIERSLEDGVIVKGGTSLRDLDTNFDIKIPLNDNYSTVAGFILDMLGNNFPEEGQMIVWEGYTFELSKVEEFEIKRIKIKDVDGDKHLFSKKEANESINISEETQEFLNKVSSSKLGS